MSSEQEKKNWLYFFLCPRCLKLATFWYDYYTKQEMLIYKVFPQPNSADEYISSEEGDEVLYISRCPFCKGEYLRYGIDFTIKISKSTYEVKPIGVYWIEQSDVLEKIRNKIIDNFLKLVGGKLAGLL